jgi:outer membrane biosynthesis protein TonB
LPWIVSLGVHLVLLAAVAVLLAAPVRTPLASHVDITFVGAPGTGRGAMRAGGSSTTGTFVPRPPRGEIVPSSPPQHEPGPFPAPRPVIRDESLPMPPAGDVLADMAAVSASASASPAAEGPAAAEAAGSPSGTQMGWEGTPRKLIRKRIPEFPTVLSAMGQEIEGEARISVAPSGIVTRVEITRSSGYIEIDAIVEAAVRDYLYSRVDGRSETAGTVHFRFRLEKQD